MSLVPCPNCGQLHEAKETPGGVEIVPCPFMPKDVIAMRSGESVAVLKLGEKIGEPVGEKVETAAAKAKRLLYGERRAAA